jgi:hypothetical protein
MAQTQNQTKPKFREIGDVRSYMVDMEVKETLHLDRVGNPWASDIARALEKLVAGVPETARLTISDDFVTLKLNDRWRVRINHDGAVVIKVTDCALVADDKFLLLCMDKDSLYEPIAKGEAITWDGTEEYFTPFEIQRFVRETIKRVLERPAHWL